MICPICKNEMETGFTWVNASSASSIEWAREEPSFSLWKQTRGDVRHWNVNLANEKTQNLKRGHQCDICSLLVIEDTGMMQRARPVEV